MQVTDTGSGYGFQILTRIETTSERTILPAGALKDLLLIGVLADQAVDGDFLALPYPVTPSHCLEVILHATTHSLCKHSVPTADYLYTVANLCIMRHRDLTMTVILYYMLCQRKELSWFSHVPDACWLSTRVNDYYYYALSA